MVHRAFSSLFWKALFNTLSNPSFFPVHTVHFPLCVLNRKGYQFAVYQQFLGPNTQKMKSMRASSLGEWKKLSPHESLLAGHSVLDKYLSLPLFHTPNKGIFQAYHWQYYDQSCLKFPQYVLWRWGPAVVLFSNGCSFFPCCPVPF